MTPERTEHFATASDGSVTPSTIRITTVLAQLPDPTYQWQRWDFATGEWVDIGGATGAYLDVVPGDVGVPYFAVRCAVTSEGTTHYSIVVAVHRSAAGRPIATEEQARVGTNNETVMTPLRTAQAVEVLDGGFF